MMCDIIIPLQERVKLLSILLIIIGLGSHYMIFLCHVSVVVGIFSFGRTEGYSALYPNVVATLIEVFMYILCYIYNGEYSLPILPILFPRLRCATIF